MAIPKEIRGIQDPYREAKSKGWDITNASTLTKDLHIEADVVIVGTGSGGGTSAEMLSKAGLKVVLVEEGPLKSSDQFDMNEGAAFYDLYQEGGGRATKAASIGIVQGRSVGGGTTVNWCSSFRTPDQTLDYWQSEFGVEGLSPKDLAPYFDSTEERLFIKKWPLAPNSNNEMIKVGCEKLEYHWDYIPRNIKGCWNLGYCGTGCPVDAKQSMLVSSIPAALDKGSSLIYRVSIERLNIKGEQVKGVIGEALAEDGLTRTGHSVTINAKHTVLSGGAINTPAILMRSNAPDPHQRIGKRTFLHPVTVSLAHFDQQIDPFYGAPQSIFSDQFTWRDGASGAMGFKLEALPLLPGTFSTILGAHGNAALYAVENLANTQAMLGFLRDGFHEQSQGGTVELAEQNRPVLDYPFSDYFSQGIRDSLTSIMEIQFAAGAKKVRPSHMNADWYSSFDEAKKALAKLDMSPGKVGLASAHAMGGCAMGKDESNSVTTSEGRFRLLENLSIFDGSLFPTSLGVNPQLTIFAVTAKLSQALATSLK